jgi:hypothetical protein
MGPMASNRPHRITLQPAVEHDIALPIRPAKSVTLEPAVEQDIALPISALKRVVTPPPPGATPAERRRWMEEHALMLGYAGSGLGLGALLGGRAGGVAGFLVGGIYAAVEITRRSR